MSKIVQKFVKKNVQYDILRFQIGVKYYCSRFLEILKFENVIINIEGKSIWKNQLQIQNFRKIDTPWPMIVTLSFIEEMWIFCKHIHEHKFQFWKLSKFSNFFFGNFFSVICTENKIFVCFDYDYVNSSLSFSHS